MDDSDLAGPLVFCLLFGMFLLLVCKVTIECLFLLSFWLVWQSSFRLCLRRRSPWMSVHLCTIVFDERKRARRKPHSKRFGLLPSSDGPLIVRDKFVPSQVGSPHRHPFDHNNTHLLRGLLCFVLTAVSVFWCTYSASAMFVSVLSMEHQRFLIAYPICLFYTCFALLTIF